MAIVRFDPFHEFATLHDRVDRLFGGQYLRDEGATPRGWAPPVDIYETESHDLVITAELPDVTREDIKVTVRSRHADAQGRAQAAGRHQGRAVPARRAALRNVHPGFHSAEYG